MGLRPTSGSWWIICPSDPRWNMNGTIPTVGGFVMPEECKQAIKQKCQELNVKKAPDDCEWHYMKD